MRIRIRTCDDHKSILDSVEIFNMNKDKVSPKEYQEWCAVTPCGNVATTQGVIDTSIAP